MRTIGTSLMELTETDEMDAFIEQLLECWVICEPGGVVCLDRTCRVCAISKPSSEFGSYKTKIGRASRSECKECVNIQARRYRMSEESKIRHNKSCREWARRNPEKIQAKQERYKERANIKQAERRRKDPSYRIAGNMRSLPFSKKTRAPRLWSSWTATSGSCVSGSRTSSRTE
jgi:hypothetical protein